jgi:uncharacterized membrane protein YcaP (DUF421 family)
MEGSKDLSPFALTIRAVVLYIALIIATQMMGHRQVGILSGHNYLVAAGIVSLAVIWMINPESSLTSWLVIIFVQRRWYYGKQTANSAVYYRLYQCSEYASFGN